MPNQFTLLILSFVFAWFTPLSVHASYITDLKSPYNINLSALNSLPIENNVTACPKPPLPGQNLDFISIYTDKSHGHSIIDPIAQQKYERQTKPLKDFEKQIYRWIEDSFQQKETSRFAIRCTIDWLDHWATHNVLLKGNISAQGEAVRKWTLASLSSHYVQIQDIKWLDRQQQKTIEEWLYKVASEVMTDYQSGTHRNSRNNNHQYWAAWSVMITGVVLNDQKFYKWGIQNYKKAIKDINPDGTMPLELIRDSRAFHYHIFAISPLVMIAETAKVNGFNLYKYKQNRLSKTARLILDELQNNQAHITQITSRQQNLYRTITSGQLAWLAVYQQHYHTRSASYWMEQFAPLIQRRIGGNLSRLYSAE